MEPPDALASAWEGVTEHWDDPARHDTFLGLVAQYSYFAWAAAKYKERSGDPIADQQLDKLRRAATATMLATARARPKDPKQPYRNTLIVLISMIVMIIFALICLKLIHDSRP